MITPNVADTYSRFYVNLFDEQRAIGVPAGFAAFFGKPGKDQTIIDPGALDFDIDIIRGNEKLAPLVLRGTNAQSIGSTNKSLNQEKFTTASRVVPLIEQITPIGASQLNKRVAGENPYSGITTFDRLRILAAKAHLEEFKTILRTFSWLATQSILTGKMPAIINTTNTELIYDFQRSANMFRALGAGEQWQNTNVNPIDSITIGAGLVRVNGKERPDMIIMGGAAMTGFLNNPNIKDAGDNRRIKLVEADKDIAPPEKMRRYVEAGFEYWGYVITNGSGYKLHMFTLPEVYTDLAGASQPYMPTDKALICYSDGRNDRFFGAFEKIPSTALDDQWYQQMFGFNPMAVPMPEVKGPASLYNSNMFYCDAFMAENKKTVNTRTQTAPIFATTQTDVYYVLSTVVA
jgi:Phage major capsid protein E